MQKGNNIINGYSLVVFSLYNNKMSTFASVKIIQEISKESKQKLFDSLDTAFVSASAKFQKPLLLHGGLCFHSIRVLVTKIETSRKFYLLEMIATKL